MAEAIDVHEVGDDFEFDTQGDETLQRVKDRARKRKGRGFVPGEDERMQVDSKDFESVEIEAGGDILGPQRSVEGWILFITNLHEETTEDDLIDTFGEFGEIKNLHLNLDRRTGFIKGYALVEYNTYKEAKTALEKMTGSEILGQKITVDWSFIQAPGEQPRRTGKRTRRR